MTLYRTVLFNVGILSLALMLSACEGAKEELGLTRTVPDEFAVIKRAPLEMPPDYSLRPPQPGVARPQETAPGRQAQSVVFGGAAQQQKTSQTAPAGSEAALLEKAGSEIAQPGIRRQVDQETAALEPREEPVAEKLLGWTTDDGTPPPASVVDAEAEAARLQKNAEEGKPVTEGETPAVEE